MFMSNVTEQDMQHGDFQLGLTAYPQRGRKMNESVTHTLLLLL